MTAYLFSVSKLSSLPTDPPSSRLKQAPGPSRQLTNYKEKTQLASSLVGCLLSQSPKLSLALGGNTNLRISIPYKHSTGGFVYML